MSLLSNNTLAGSSGQGGGGYAIERSLRFNSADSAYLNRTPSSAGNRKTWTWAGWVKRSAIGTAKNHIFVAGPTTSSNATYIRLAFNTDDTFFIGLWTTSIRTTSAVFRDPSAWYHIVVAMDTANATEADRCIIYVNGVRQTVSGAVTQNDEYGINAAQLHHIGNENNAGYFNGYLADVHFIDGQALAASDFGEYDSNSVWQPKRYSGSYGTNGSHLDFSDTSSNAALGTDTSGNSNTWTVNNLSVAAGAGNDSLRDSPTNGTQTDTGVGGEVVGNYATLNPLHPLATATLANGNLQTTSSAPAFSTFLLKSGKWYCEHTVTTAAYNLCFTQIDHPSGATPSSANSKSIGWYMDGPIYWGGSNSLSVGSYAAGDVVAAGVDMDNSTIKLYKNGSLVHTIDFSTGSYHRFTDGMYISQFDGYGTWNFGQRAFAYTAPSGYKALCTANLDDPTIEDGSTAFDVVTYTSDGTSRTISGLNMSPDLVWSKRRSASARHVMSDSVRGVNNELFPNLTTDERTSTDGLIAFNSDGYTLGADASQYGWQADTNTFVNWAWDAGSSNTTIAAGGLNSSAYDQSQTWSGQVSGTAYSGYPKTRTFDLNDANNAHPADNNELVFTPSPSFSSASTVKIWYYYPSTHVNAFKINGTAVGNDVAQTSSILTHTFNVSGFTSLSWSRNKYGSEDAAIARIDVDGVQLVDSGVSVTNVPSIASTVRANPSAGFSIVSYTGNGGNTAKTVGHGLNATPEFIIIKSRDSATGWEVFHGTQPGKLLYLHTADAAQTSGSFGTPSSSTITVADTWINATGDDYIAYCFAPVEGYSSFGSYTGNGSADGPFVYTGFRPRYLLWKSTSSGQQWFIHDTSRSPYNFSDSELVASSSAAEYSASGVGAGQRLDFVSNGFKVRTSNNANNTSGQTFIYAAFAEHPFKTSRAR